MNLSQMLNSKLNHIEKLKYEIAKNYIDIINLGMNNNNIPLATKYSDELLKMFPDNIDFMIVAANVYAYSDYKKSEKYIDRLEKMGIDRERLRFAKAMSSYTKGNYCNAFKLFGINSDEETIYKEISKALCKNSKVDLSKFNKKLKNPSFFLKLASLLLKESMFTSLLELGKKGKNIFSGEGIVKSSIMVAKANIMLGRLDRAKKEIDNIKILLKGKRDIDFDMLIKCYDEAIGNVKEIYGNKSDCSLKGINITVKIDAEHLCNVDEKELEKGRNTILITSDQGFGDNIMYYPFLSHFIDKYGKNNKIILYIYKDLFDLFSSLKDKVEFRKYLDNSDTDYIFKQKIDYKAMVSDMKAFVDIDDLNQLYSLQEKYSLKDSNISVEDAIAICWKTDYRNPDSIQKSFSLEDFLKHIDIEKIDKPIYSVQKNVTSEEIEILNRYDIKIFDKELNSFQDTANILNRVNRVYTIDTSILHLSAMLEKETICLLNRHFDCKFVKDGWLYKNLTVKRICSTK